MALGLPALRTASYAARRGLQNQGHPVPGRAPRGSRSGGQVPAPDAKPASILKEATCISFAAGAEGTASNGHRTPNAAPTTQLIKQSLRCARRGGCVESVEGTTGLSNGGRSGTVPAGRQGSLGVRDFRFPSGNALFRRFHGRNAAGPLRWTANAAVRWTIPAKMAGSRPSEAITARAEPAEQPNSDRTNGEQAMSLRHACFSGNEHSDLSAWVTKGRRQSDWKRSDTIPPLTAITAGLPASGGQLSLPADRSRRRRRLQTHWGARRDERR